MSNIGRTWKGEHPVSRKPGQPDRDGLIVLASEDPKLVGATIVLGREPTRIGREASEHGIVIESPRVSRKHAQIEWRNLEWRCVDLGSSNGTWVNAQPITDVGLSDADEMIVGLTLLRCVFGESAGERLAKRRAELEEYEPWTNTLSRSGVCHRLDTIVRARSRSARCIGVEIQIPQAVTRGEVTFELGMSEYAATLKACLGSGDQIGRIGNDAFVLLTPELDRAAAIALAHRVVESFAKLTPGGESAGERILATCVVAEATVDESADDCIERISSALDVQVDAGCVLELPLRGAGARAVPQILAPDAIVRRLLEHPDPHTLTGFECVVRPGKLEALPTQVREAFIADLLDVVIAATPPGSSIARARDRFVIAAVPEGCDLDAFGRSVREGFASYRPSTPEARFVRRRARMATMSLNEVGRRGMSSLDTLFAMISKASDGDSTYDLPFPLAVLPTFVDSMPMGVERAKATL
ncbi:MAG: FHA domain-containing protein, partial [Deltaproteobacteria bacterium]